MDSKDEEPPNPGGRGRAPTITIDTSAVGAPPTAQEGIAMDEVSNSPQGLQRSTTGPHNFSPPPTGSPANYLSVPGGLGKADSIDSESTFGGSNASGSNTAVPMSLDGEVSKTLEPQTREQDGDPLQPDPGTEEDFVRENNKFAFTPGQLGKLINPKSLNAFRALGGLAGIETGLRTNIKSGLSTDEEYLDGNVTFDDAIHATDSSSRLKQIDSVQSFGRRNTEQIRADAKRDTSFADRKRIFSDNRLPVKKAKSIFELMWITYNDKVLILLSIAAAVSLAVGIYQSVQISQEKGSHEAPVEWVEGVAIMVAIFIVVVVGAANDYQKERQFVKLNKKKDDRYIKVTRSGKVQEVSIYDIFVGDVVLLEPGDLIPVDGIFIEGHNVKCDESSATGESDLLKKTPANEVWSAMEAQESLKKLDPFILSGSKVAEGIGSFVTTATGVNSAYGKTMMSLRDEGEVTPLQSKLNVLAEQIAKLGGAAALLYFIVAFIEFLVRITRGSEQSLPAAEKGQQFLNIFIVAVSVIVVAVPEGLPLAVTLALAFATTRMLKDNNLVRLLRSCETMGNATTVCSDKTGTLTQNKMSVVAATLGTSSRFGDKRVLTQGATSNDNGKQRSGSVPRGSSDDVTTQEFVSTLHSDVTQLLMQEIAINSTAFEGEEEGKPAFIGSKTEMALLHMAREHLGMGPVSVERSSADIVQFVPFDSGRKCMAAVVKLPGDRYRMYVKGASEIMLRHCSKIIDDPTRGIKARDMSKENMETLQHLISTYASRSLRTIAFLYKDYESWPPAGVRPSEDDPNQARFDDLLQNMTFLGVVGIQDPLRPGVAKAVADCARAGVFVRMVTGDNVETAKAIATDCGIFTPGGIVLEGPEFRKLSKKQMNEKIPRLQVLARSSPEDKRILVKRLKELGETVAVTGDGTNDAPALKTADVGFSMGITGTEVAKEASAIILMDDNFSSIVKALMWGRAVNDAVKKFLQFQLTVNITAVIITFVSGVASPNGNPVLTAVQLLWVNLIMDTFAALALATDPPAPSVLDRKPDRKSAPLISVTMWKMIIGQAIYQLVVSLVLDFAGQDILSYQSAHEKEQLRSLIFNAFVWMQIFNAFNNRRLDNKFNIFEGIHRNVFFIAIICIMVGGQVLIIFVGGAAISVTRLNGAQWGYSIVLGALTLPIGVIVRLIPDQLITALIPDFLKQKAAPRLVVEDEDDRYEWNPALQEIREELVFLKKFKGGRLNNLRFKIKHPRESGMLPPRPSTTRSRSSTNASLNQQQSTAEGSGRPTTPLPPPSPARSANSDRKSGSRGRSRSNSAFGPSIAAAGIVAGSIAGWSPIERSGVDGIDRFPPASSSPPSQHAPVQPQGEPQSRPLGRIASEDENAQK